MEGRECGLFGEEGRGSGLGRASVEREQGGSCDALGTGRGSYSLSCGGSRAGVGTGEGDSGHCSSENMED